MSLRIGRVTGLAEPTESPGWQNNSDGSVTLNATYRATSVADGLVKRDQLLGYVNNMDELVVPVIMDNESRVTGYYRVVAVSMATDKFTRKSGHIYNLGVTLIPVWGFTQPMLEAVINGALLTNVKGALVTDMRGFHTVPLAANDYFSNSTPGLSTITQVSADGGLLHYQLKATGTPDGSAVSRFALAPSNFYVGAATFEQGSPLAIVVGRSLQTDVVNWRLSNGLLRITANASAGKIDVSGYNGTTWSTVKTYNLNGTSVYGAILGFNSLTLLRNSVEEVILRLTLNPTNSITATNNGTLTTLDIALRRGDRFARCYIVSAQADAWRIARDSAEAATAYNIGAATANVGIRATANDSDGNRYLIPSVQNASTFDLVQGSVRATATTATFDFGLGLEIGGTGSVTPDTLQLITQNYFCAQDESQRIVAR